MADAELVHFANLFRAREIRLELQTLRRRIKARQYAHLREFGSDAITSGLLFTMAHKAESCGKCQRLEGAIDGVNEAIRMFGGKVEEKNGKADD